MKYVQWSFIVRSNDGMVAALFPFVLLAVAMAGDDLKKKNSPSQFQYNTNPMRTN